MFLLATDGVHEHVGAARDGRRHRAQPRRRPGRGGARASSRARYERGSADNLTVQLVRVDALPRAASARSCCSTAPSCRSRRCCSRAMSSTATASCASCTPAAAATSISPSTRARRRAGGAQGAVDRPARRRRLPGPLPDGRVDRPPHRQPARAASPRAQTRPRSYLYLVTEYIEGQTLAQWMRDHPQPDLETVRGIVEQVARGPAGLPPPWRCCTRTCVRRTS